MSTYYRRNLPHFHPDNIPLFITFRLAGSLSPEILSKLKEERDLDIQNASSPERYDTEKKHFARYDEWLDRYKDSPRWLSNEEIANIVAKKIQELSHEHYQLLAYCIMPNHVHLLIKSLRTGKLSHQGKTAKYPVADSLRLLKGSTARECNQALKRSGAFWQHESYDHFVRDEKDLGRIIHYILNNPVKAGLVRDWRSWLFTYILKTLGNFLQGIKDVILRVFFTRRISPSTLGDSSLALF